jgi:hypothetical protein
MMVAFFFIDTLALPVLLVDMKCKSHIPVVVILTFSSIVTVVPLNKQTSGLSPLTSLDPEAQMMFTFLERNLHSS